MTTKEVYYNRPEPVKASLNVEVSTTWDDMIPPTFLAAAVFVATGVALTTTKIPILGPLLCSLGIWSFYKAIRTNEPGSDAGKGI